ncbi:MAG: FAD-dependent oxidoreductase [Candidatus Eisenbacteria bacterium]
MSAGGPGFVRRSQDLRGRSFDCVVVGGGIHGASLLFELTSRGYRTLLVERRDFGRGASARSLRILHGGLRYLQSFDLARFRESVEARRWFLRAFPEFTAPRSFLLPLDGKGVRHPVPFSAAFALDAWLSRERNHGVLPTHHLPAGRVVRRENLDGVPQVTGAGGAFASWSDGWIADPQRLLLEYLRWSASLGATVTNHTAARPLVRDGELTGMVLTRDGHEVEIAAPLVVLSAGAWTEPTLNGWGWKLPSAIPTAKAFNLVLSGATDLGTAGGTPVSGLGVRARDGRNAFLWSDARHTHVGTVHRIEDSTPDEVGVTIAEAEELLRAVDEHLPSVGLLARRIVSVQVGRLPSRSGEDPEMPHRDHVVSPDEFGGPKGLFVTMGLKYTTAPVVASRVVDRLGLRPDPSGARSIDHPNALPPRPTSRGPLRIPDLLASWETETDATLEALQVLREEEAAFGLADLVLGRLDGSEDTDAARELAGRLAARLYTTEAERTAQLQGLERALASQSLREHANR